MQKEFTKDMLIAGEYVVELSGDGFSGEKYGAVFKETIQYFNENFTFYGFDYISTYNNNLKTDYLEILKVYEIRDSIISSISDKNLVWERPLELEVVKTKLELRLEELEQKQREIADEMAKIREDM